MADLDKLLNINFPTSPNREIGLILVTGATGYIGGRLIPELLARKYRVRVMVRSLSDEHLKQWPGAEIVEADAMDPDKLNAALKGVDTVYYFIHSLLLGQKNFEQRDLLLAENFRKASEFNKVRQIIYLGGLGDPRTRLSAHLKNRKLVTKKLSEGPIPVTVLRAAMIIGAGSASYKILSHLVRNSPIFFIPNWAKTKAQPIALRDVIKYLVGAMEVDECLGKDYDIGGSTVLSYEDKLRKMAKMLGTKKLFLPAIITNRSFYGYLASILTPVPGPVTRSLINGCNNEVICHDNKIRDLIKFTPLTFDEAIKEAIADEEQGITD